MARISFSGHDTFICKQFWLKKGFDFLSDEQASFSNEDSVVRLGVGKNMVRSIRFWLRSFEVVDSNDEYTSLGEYLFGKEGRDPYLESLGSIWLLHYHLVMGSHATIYNLFFNKFRRLRQEFTSEQLLAFITRFCSENDVNVSSNTLQKDVRVFLNNYMLPSSDKKGPIEDAFSGLLYELRLLDRRQRKDIITEETQEYFIAESTERSTLPTEVFLYALLNYMGEKTTVTFHDLLLDADSPGSIFALDPGGLHTHIMSVVDMQIGCSFSETAGNRIVQRNSNLKNSLNLLDEYYN